jgi:hypothetical protein
MDLYRFLCSLSAVRFSARYASAHHYLRRSEEGSMGKKKLKVRRSVSTPHQENFRIEQSLDSPHTGVRFPEGSRRVAFEIFCETGGNYSQTRRLIAKRKALGSDSRAPSIRTLRLWAERQHWDVLRQMVDEGIYDILTAENDPDIQNAIRDEAGLFKFLSNLQSRLYVNLVERNSPLMPRNNRDFVNTMKYINDALEPLSLRMGEVLKTKGASRAAQDGAQTVGEHAQELSLADIPDNVASMEAILQQRGIAPTRENLARVALEQREAKRAREREANEA